MSMRSLPSCLLLAAGFVVTRAAPLVTQTYDLIVRNGRVLDGTGSPSFNTDVGVEGGV